MLDYKTFETSRGNMKDFEAGIFELLKRNFKFKSKVDATARTRTKLQRSRFKPKEVCEVLTQTLRTLRKKIDKLEMERASLFTEIEKLKVAES